MSTETSTNPPTRLQRLLKYLEADPTNPSLIADVGATALAEKDLATASRMVDRSQALGPLNLSIANLKGLIAIEEGRFADAAELFRALIVQDAADPALRYNLACCKAAQGNYEAAAILLDEQTALQSARAATLAIRMLHHLGRLDDALAQGEVFSRQFGRDPDLAGALAAIALDAEQLELAKAYADRAGDQHDGLAALGMLALNDEKVDQALAYFDRALGAYPSDARGLLGKGLGLMAKGDTTSAVPYVDQAAELFERHLGTWVAAGWSHFVTGDYGTSRARFEKAAAIDDTFAEIHGGLAVLDIVEGKMDSAKRRTELALRLDRRCFSGALARTLLLTSQGDHATAARIRDMALNAPIDASGRTLAQAMVRMGLSARPQA